MKLRTLISAAILAAFATVAHAEIVLDDFNLPNPGAQAVTSGLGSEDNNVTNSVSFSGAGILGGRRILDVTCDSGCDDSLFRFASLAVEKGQLSWANTSDVRSTAGVTWDGGSAYGLGANLLSMGSTIVATVLEADLGFNYQLTMWTNAGKSTVLSTGTVNDVLPSAPESSTFQVSWWALPANFYFLDGLPFEIAHTGGGVDLTQVNKIEFRMNNIGTCFVAALDPEIDNPTCSTAVDLRIDKITVIPEPASLALVGLALLGAGVTSSRRFRKI